MMTEIKLKKEKSGIKRFFKNLISKKSKDTKKDELRQTNFEISQFQATIEKANLEVMRGRTTLHTPT